MKNVDEHCKHTLDTVGIEGRDIHSWIDEPCKLFGPSHRRVRHDVAGLKDAIKVFNGKYSTEDITKVYVSHVLADLNSEPHHTLSKSEQLNDKTDDGTIRKSLDRELKLSGIRTGRIRDYLKIAFVNNPKKQGQFTNAYFALLTWEKYILSKENPSNALTTKDIAAYSLNLRSRSLKAKTASNYLLYLSWYFKEYNEIEFYKESVKQYKLFVDEFETEKKRVPIKYVWAIYKHAEDVTNQVLLRLLIFETLPLESLEYIKFVKTIDGKYKFINANEKVISLDEETIKIAEPLLNDNLANKIDFLLPITKRTMQDRIHKIRKQIGIQEIITLQDLRKFGERQNKEEMLQLFRGNDFQSILR